MHAHHQHMQSHLLKGHELRGRGRGGGGGGGGGGRRVCLQEVQQQLEDVGVAREGGANRGCEALDGQLESDQPALCHARI